MEIEREVRLPGGGSCMTWSAVASRAVPVGPRAWRAVERTAAGLLRCGGKGDVAAWVWERPWRTGGPSAASLVTLFIGSDRQLDAADWRHALPAGAGWLFDGAHPRPVDAFPVLARIDGELLQLWRQDRQGLFCERLRRVEGRVERQCCRVGEAETSSFLPRLSHALIEGGRVDQADTRRKQRFEMAFAYRVAQRIIEADGVIDSDEASFLRASFPSDRMAALGLQDAVVREEVADMAEAQLAQLLSHHEKLALLNLFYGTSRADGRVAVGELNALREAAATLEIDSGEVVRYLARLAQPTRGSAGAAPE